MYETLNFGSIPQHRKELGMSIGKLSIAEARMWLLLMGSSLALMGNVAVIDAKDGTGGARDASPSETILLEGTKTQKVGSGRRLRGIQRPYAFWKLDLDNYLYKRFYAVISDRNRGHYIPPLPMGSVIDGKLYPYTRFGIPRKVQARRIMTMRFVKAPGGAKHGGMAKGFAKFRYSPHSDWRAFDVLRADVNTAEDCHVWLCIEDTVLQPPVAGYYAVKAGKWFTLEIDLKKAAKERGLNLGEMRDMWVDWDNRADGQFGNVRLVRRGTETKYPILQDPRATQLPAHPPKKGPPVPDVKLDHSPLTETKTMTFESRRVIGLTASTGKSSSQLGAFRVVDPKHVLLIHAVGNWWFSPKGVAASKLFENVSEEKRKTDVLMKVPPGTRPKFISYIHSETFAVQTLDGGKTWTGVNGEAKPTHLKGGELGRTYGLDSLGGVIVHNQKGCSADPGPRHRVAKWSFLGSKGWGYNEKDYILEEEARHCTTCPAAFTRLPSGRIWAGLKVEGRWVPDVSGIHARYSDTDGMHWHTWKKGRTGRIPGSSGMGQYLSIKAAPYKKHVAVFWVSRRGRNSPKQTHWSWFDGTKWSSPAEVGAEVRSVVTVGKSAIFASTSKKGILRLEKDAWVPSLKQGGTLCRSGDDLMVFRMPRRGSSFEVLQMDANGQWGKPRRFDVGGEMTECSVQKHCPPNLGALAYGLKGKENTVNIMLVPNVNCKKGTAYRSERTQRD